MATIIILLGSMLGFVGGVVAYVGFDAGFLAALGIWLGAGPASALLVILSAAPPTQHPTEQPILAKVA